jgi:hypothetical protein
MYQGSPPKITVGIDPVDWLPEEMNWLGSGMRLPASAKIIAMLLETRIATLLSFSHRSRSLLCPQVFDKQRWLTRRGFDGRVICVESQLDVSGRRSHVVDIHTE